MHTGIPKIDNGITHRPKETCHWREQRCDEMKVWVVKKEKSGDRVWYIYKKEREEPNVWLGKRKFPSLQLCVKITGIVGGVPDEYQQKMPHPLPQIGTKKATRFLFSQIKISVLMPGLSICYLLKVLISSGDYWYAIFCSLVGCFSGVYLFAHLTLYESEKRAILLFRMKHMRWGSPSRL